jgi:uncharacterized tellurite resistance protein B-like protein
MLDSIRSFFSRTMQPDAPAAGGNGAPHTPPSTTGDEQKAIQVAACALQLELAHADDEFTEGERLHIEAVLRRHLALDETTAKELMALAEKERESAIDLYQFTSLIRSNYDLGQKTLLAEVMWGLILTDGEIARHEAYMLRKITNLLDLEPGYLAQARKRAEAQMD